MDRKPFDQRRGQGVLASAFGFQQKLAQGRSHLGREVVSSDLRTPFGQRTGLVERYAVNVTQVLQGCGILDEDMVLGGLSDADH